MKHIILIVAMFVGFVNVQAQELKSYTMAVSDADDSLTNADTGYATISFSAGRYDMMFEITVTKVSGTVAGTIEIQGSNDNSTWQTLASDNEGEGFDAGITYFQGDTATLTNATATYKWLITGGTGWRHRYYRARVITTGTSVVGIEVTAPKVWARLRND